MMSSKSIPDKKQIAIIGGGASGLVAAIFAAQSGAAVTIFEHNRHSRISEKTGAFLGKKLRITGKGRCNLTNLCGVEEFLRNVPRNPKFLYKALTEFTPSDTMEFFEELGVPLKVERGNRVFPVSDKAIDVVSALEKRVKALGVKVENIAVTEITADSGKVTGVIAGGKQYCFDNVILCTGGVSYSACGSTGDGYTFTKKLGHTVVDPKPSLVPLESDDEVCNECMGLTLKNTGCEFRNSNGKVLYSEQGELLFAHFGVTGPVVLSASAHIAAYPVVLSLDLKPALDFEKLDKRIIRDFEDNKNKEFKNSLGALLPSALVSPVVKRSGIDPEKRVNEVTREERRALVGLLKSFEIVVKGTRPINEAVITSGGISVKEINPTKMQSKLVEGLFFAGEIIDCDAYTGGFNLQIAFSTARIAALSAAKGANQYE
ncbi:MAG: NAD(P)/FAD-dependent oxidoreductase [Eubacteriales bacterium]|nr:NAD(P)/FAD-dependent oxidoreductase [Eubacteriales bacterium]MDD4476162.1 NAD(P)/FAD-dependent oxidoreductase [Eubacteriales bacterium]